MPDAEWADQCGPNEAISINAAQPESLALSSAGAAASVVRPVAGPTQRAQATDRHQHTENWRR